MRPSLSDPCPASEGCSCGIGTSGLRRNSTEPPVDPGNPAASHELPPGGSLPSSLEFYASSWTGMLHLMREAIVTPTSTMNSTIALTRNAARRPAAFESHKFSSADHAYRHMIPRNRRQLPPAGFQFSKDISHCDHHWKVWGQGRLGHRKSCELNLLGCQV